MAAGQRVTKQFSLKDVYLSENTRLDFDFQILVSEQKCIASFTYFTNRFLFRSDRVRETGDSATTEWWVFALTAGSIITAFVISFHTISAALQNLVRSL